MTYQRGTLGSSWHLFLGKPLWDKEGNLCAQDAELSSETEIDDPIVYR